MKTPDGFYGHVARVHRAARALVCNHVLQLRRRLRVWLRQRAWRLPPAGIRGRLLSDRGQRLPRTRIFPALEGPRRENLESVVQAKRKTALSQN